MSGEHAVTEQDQVAPQAPAVSVAAPVTVPTGLDVISLQRSIGNRATGRLLRSPARARLLQRDFDWSKAQKSLSLDGTLDAWLAANPITPRDPEHEMAFHKGDTLPPRLGCVWQGKMTTIDVVADAFMAESTKAGLCYVRDAVIRQMRDRLSHAKHERADEILFLARSDPKNKDQAPDAFPWQAYEESTDQLTAGAADPRNGPAGPIADWLTWYQFDAVSADSTDPDECRLMIEGSADGARVPGVVRLYYTEAIRCGFLGAGTNTVETFVRSELAKRKEYKRSGAKAPYYVWDGRGIRDDRRQQAFGPPPKVSPPTPETPDPNFTIQYQFNLSKSAPTGGGAATPNPAATQVTLQDIVLRIPVKGLPNDPQFQIVLMGSATFNLPQSGPPVLLRSTLSNYQAAGQVAYAQDLFKDILQLQLFGQVVGGSNVGPVSSSTSTYGPLKVGQAAMAQVVGGVQLAFTIPGTEKRWQIFVQYQASKTYTGAGNTNDQQVSFGIAYAPKWLNP